MLIKTLKGKEKILQSAIEEFATQGYAMGSVNTICEKGSISKGALYHHYKDKDSLYLACLKECFSSLTDYLKTQLLNNRNISMQSYFSARITFFENNPFYHKLFVEATLFPFQALQSAIKEIKAEFDTMNVSILTAHISQKPLRKGITMEQAIQTFSMFQDFVNAREQLSPNSEFNIRQHEMLRSISMDILLYGIIERECPNHE